MIIYKTTGPGLQLPWANVLVKRSTLIHVTNGASHPYHLDDSTFNYRHQESHFVLLFALMKKHRRERHVCYVTSGVISVDSKCPPGLFGLNVLQLEFPIQAQRQRNSTCLRRSRPPKE